MLRSLILALLAEAPNSGYGLGRLLRERLSHLREARLQQIYAELARLEGEGLIAAETIALLNRPAKKVYSVTKAGERALGRWLAKRPRPHVCRDELLLQLYRVDWMPRVLMVRRLEERRNQATALAGTLRAKLTQVSHTDPDQLGYLLTMQAALARAEADASWCGWALDLVENGRREQQLEPEADASSEAGGAG